MQAMIALFFVFLKEYTAEAGMIRLQPTDVYKRQPVFITSRIPSLGVAVIMMVSMLIELTVAVWKGWFLSLIHI